MMHLLLLLCHTAYNHLIHNNLRKKKRSQNIVKILELKMYSQPKNIILAYNITKLDKNN